MTDTPGPGLDAITRDDLLHALTCFYLAVRDYRGHQYAGQIEFPDKVADALYATLSRIVAERPPAADPLTGLREEVQRLRTAADDHAADLMDEGKDAERAYGRVEAYDQILARLSRMEADRR
jgi:hypothetical protein